MPINKFGHHFLYESIPNKLKATPKTSFDLSSFKSVCILTLRGTPSITTTSFTFENNLYTYKFEISGIIQQVDTSLETALFTLNKGPMLSLQNLIDTTVNKGDVIKIYRDPSKPLSPIFVQFILHCPLVKDE